MKHFAPTITRDEYVSDLALWQAHKGTAYERQAAATIAAQCDGEIAEQANTVAGSLDRDERAEAVADLERLLEMQTEYDAWRVDFAGRCADYETRTGRDWDASPALSRESDETRFAFREVVL